MSVSHSQFQRGETKSNSVRIAIAKDAAFNFYYKENLELLQSYGAELVEFSPLKGDVLPSNIHGLYIGGWVSEEFAEELAGQEAVKQSIRIAIENGLPTLAECGGFMFFLTEAIEETNGRKTRNGRYNSRKCENAKIN
ncbi:hypothetical protein GCM10020331_062320 [Ectobacillus funiculus]